MKKIIVSFILGISFLAFSKLENSTESKIDSESTTEDQLDWSISEDQISKYEAFYELLVNDDSKQSQKCFFLKQDIELRKAFLRVLLGMNDKEKEEYCQKMEKYSEEELKKILQDRIDEYNGLKCVGFPISEDEVKKVTILLKNPSFQRLKCWSIKKDIEGNRALLKVLSRMTDKEQEEYFKRMKIPRSQNFQEIFEYYLVRYSKLKCFDCK
jgi:hypothetical protein